MAPAAPPTVTLNTPQGHLLWHSVNAWPRPIQSPRTESHDPRRLAKVVPPAEPAATLSAEAGAFLHWIFTPEPGRSEGNDLHGGTRSDHVPANAIVTIILTMVIMGGLLVLVVGGQMLRWLKEAKLARVKVESGIRRASTSVPQVGGSLAVGLSIHRPRWERASKATAADGQRVAEQAFGAHESLLPRLRGKHDGVDANESESHPLGGQFWRAYQRNPKRVIKASQEVVSTTLPGGTQAGISAEDQECIIGKDRVPSRQYNACEESETSVSDAGDCICTTMELSPRTETAAEEEYPAEKIGGAQEAAMLSPRIDGANKVEGMEGRQVLECDSFTPGKGDLAQSQSQLALESLGPSRGLLVHDGPCSS
ncbi:hypothetical protein EDD17DRAFT_1753562 [Pisolithus thermaeus]|nr:hypothetical protein EV401DRAFT_2063540 [Pisolithus croceorrhizus]KAI6166106.1 hypothetical protein EDD17DRAFT_1753562 [Pisolithus thermaeus]